MKKIIQTDNAPAAVGPYSQAVEANGVLYISGQVPLVPSTMKVIEGGIEEQTQQSLDNIDAIIKEAGYDKKNIVKCGIFVSDLGNFKAMNSVYEKYVGDAKPARFCVEAAKLPLDVLVEIDAIVVK